MSSDSELKSLLQQKEDAMRFLDAAILELCTPRRIELDEIQQFIEENDLTVHFDRVKKTSLDIYRVNKKLTLQKYSLRLANIKYNVVKLKVDIKRRTYTWYPFKLLTVVWYARKLKQLKEELADKTKEVEDIQQLYFTLINKQELVGCDTIESYLESRIISLLKKRGLIVPFSGAIITKSDYEYDEMRNKHDVQSPFFLLESRMKKVDDLDDLDKGHLIQRSLTAKLDKLDRKTERMGEEEKYPEPEDDDTVVEENKMVVL
jgi:hypothetical protein